MFLLGIPNHNEIDFYDICTNFVHDLSFYEKIFTPNTGTILELGAGTGRLTIPLAEKHFRVLALDISKKMLRQAQKKCPKHLQKNITWLQADMAKFRLSSPASGVIIAANSFLLLPSITHQKICLLNIAKNIKTGAIVVIDIFHPFHKLQQPECQGQLSLLASIENYQKDTTLNHWCCGRYDTAKQVIIANNIIELCSNGEVKRYPYTEILRYLHRFEMDLLLQQTGFHVENVFGWYDQRPFEHTSQKMIFVAKKR